MLIPVKAAHKPSPSDLEVYRERGGVLFISFSRFWEPHGFVQQSLAYELSQAKIPVVWLDGSGWRKYSPCVSAPNPYLTVKQLVRLPFCSLRSVSQLNTVFQGQAIQSILNKMGKRPVIWVQDGIAEELAARLPYIDVYSVFDDPLRHHSKGTLCQRARVITVQNSFSKRVFERDHAKKLHLMVPPVALGADTFETSDSVESLFPKNFPLKRMGYVGTFFEDGFNLDYFESFIRSMPDWGFVLAGRTDLFGQRRIREFSKYPNFCWIPWVSRSKLAGIWSKLSVSLLLYRPVRHTHGAFPVKILESLHFGVPVVCTRIPKTDDLKAFFPMTNSVLELKEQALRVVHTDPATTQKAYRHFLKEMDPRYYLQRVAECITE